MNIALHLRTLAVVLVVFAIAGSASYWHETGLGHEKLRSDTLQQAGRRAVQLAEAQADHLEALLLGADMTLRHFRDAYQAGDRKAVEKIVATAMASFPEGSITHFSAIDKDGYIEYASLGRTQRIFVGDRDYVKFHIGSDQDRLFINKPFQGRAAKGKWIMLLTRPIFKNNRLSGIAVMSLSPEYISRAVADVDMEKNDVITVFFQDGAYLARSSNVLEVLGKTLPPDRPFLQPDASATGTFRAVSNADQIRRLFAWQRVEGYPLVINIGLDEEALQVPIEREIAAARERGMGGIMILLALVGLVALLLFRGARQQQQLSESNALLTTIIDTVPMRVFWKDRELRFLGCNEAFARDAGRRCAKELVGANDYDLVWKAQAERYRTDDEQVIASGVARLGYEEPQTSQTGETMWLRTSKVPLYDRNHAVVGVLGIYEDVTASKMAASRRELLEYALNHVEEAAYLVDREGRFSYVNEGAVRQLGYTREELLTMGVPDIDRDFPMAMWSAHWQELSEKGAVTIETTHTSKDGRVFPIEVNANYIIFEGHAYNLALVRDISKRREMQSRLEEAKQTAETLARTKGEFLANMSHEIRTPLNAVLGLARIGTRENKGRRSGDTCRGILEAGTHLLGIINNVLDYSKIGSAKLKVEPHPFSLTKILGDVTAFVYETARQKNLAYGVETAPDLPQWVIGDSLRLQQILINLLSNAFKFTDEGEVRVRVACEGGVVYFKIIDTGIGMTEEHLERLFRPFEQADNSTTRRFGGSGLGLVISRDLAELMGGDIMVESAPGAGSAFTLWLPLPETAQPEVADENEDGAHLRSNQLAGLRILAAEDIEVNRFILADLLAEAGATCVFVEDGEKAVALVREDRTGFDIVLMDVQMPVMDGYEATRQICAMAPNIPVIGLTAHALLEEREKCLAAGMLDHVTKPIDSARLVAAILRCIGHGAARPVPSAPSFPVDAPRQNLVDWQLLDQRFKGRRTFILTLAKTVFEDHADDPQRLIRTVEARDAVELGRLAHALKGICGNLAAASVQAEASAIEAAVMAGDAAVFDRVRVFAGLVADFLQELSCRVATGDAGEDR